MTSSALINARSSSVAVPKREPMPLVHRRPATRGPVLFGFVAITVFFGTFTVWSTLAPLSRAAVAPGLIQVEGTRKTIQHLEGGIVREILVKNGDVVHQGQVLMRLDDTASDSTTASLRAIRWSMMAQAARAQAELAGEDKITFPSTLMEAAKNDPYAVEAIQAQQILFGSQQAGLQSQIKVLDLRAEEAKSLVDAADGQLKSLQRQLDLIDTEIADVAGLLRSGLETKPHLYALQRTLAQLLGNRNDAFAERARAETQISEARAQITQLRNQKTQAASDELRDANVKVIEASEKLRAAEDVSTRRTIVAPDDGTILNMRFFTIGAVVRPGEAVMELVPSHDRLVADVRIQPHDVDDIHTGMSAEVRFPAFSSRLTPYLNGTVTYIAPDATDDEKAHMTFYRAQVEISEQELKRLPQQEKVIAGMPVQVEILAGKRSLLQYLIQPMMNSFSRAFHES